LTDQNNSTKQQFVQPLITPTILPTPPATKLLSNDYQIFQSFNNCGPASLSMALSYYNIHKTQEELGQILRPYQNPQGDNDDKSVTLDELAKEGEKYGLIAYHRPNGTIEKLKAFITLEIPVITRTWLYPNEDIGHFRVVKGYDDTTGEIIQDDSYQGHNIHYSYDTFNSMWDKFGYEYLILVPQDKQKQAEAILGNDKDEKIAWRNAISSFQGILKQDPTNIDAQFNLSVAYYNIGDYKQSVAAYEKVMDRLPVRTLWYQIEPIKAYYQLGNDQKVFDLTDTILNHDNRAFSELYILRGKIYEKNGNLTAAKSEYEKSVFYNKNLTDANNALADLEKINSL
jgi:tetratricopeptide (TPR) repeat protein